MFLAASPRTPPLAVVAGLFFAGVVLQAQAAEDVNVQLGDALSPSRGQRASIREYAETLDVGSPSIASSGNVRLQQPAATPSSSRSKGGVGPRQQQQQCRRSVTSVNGRLVCEGELLFLENFDSLEPSLWRHDVRIAGLPDYEFTTFSESLANTYVVNGQLVIRPTLTDDVYGADFVRTGRLQLDNCTAGSSNSELCTKQAKFGYILPPVLSGRISTQKSFSFRYGRLDVRAKLPSGDWIYPELWLLPREEAYGAGLRSGRIQLAMARGNAELSLGSTELGLRRLEGAAIVSAAEDARTGNGAKVFNDDGGGADGDVGDAFTLPSGYNGRDRGEATDTNRPAVRKSPAKDKVVVKVTVPSTEASKKTLTVTTTTRGAGSSKQTVTGAGSTSKSTGTREPAGEAAAWSTASDHSLHRRSRDTTSGSDYSGPLRKEVIRTELPGRPWSGGFHNYTLQWTPDEIVFSVDGVELGSLLPERSGGFLPAGLTDNLDNQQRGKMAPFDREFYISLGLAVGGIHNFPDGVEGPNGARKPWRNTAAKAMLSFWNAKDDWFPTWSTDSALLVDFVRVAAL